MKNLLSVFCVLFLSAIAIGQTQVINPEYSAAGSASAKVEENYEIALPYGYDIDGDSNQTSAPASAGANAFCDELHASCGASGTGYKSVANNKIETKSENVGSITINAGNGVHRCITAGGSSADIQADFKLTSGVGLVKAAMYFKIDAIDNTIPQTISEYSDVDFSMFLMFAKFDDQTISITWNTSTKKFNVAKHIRKANGTWDDATEVIAWDGDNAPVLEGTWYAHKAMAANDTVPVQSYCTSILKIDRNNFYINDAVSARQKFNLKQSSTYTFTPF